MSIFGRSATVVVLAGEGLTGRAWLAGLLAGLDEAGLDVLSGARDRTVLATGAGAVVAARVAAGVSVRDQYAEFRHRTPPEVETTPPKAIAQLTWLGVRHRSPDRHRTAVTAFARTAPDLVDHRQRVRRLLGDAEWPSWPLWITAVDVDSAEREVLSRQGTLAEAVAASTAGPGCHAPVPIGGHRYVAGAVASAANVDLAAGFGRVLVLSASEDGSASRPGARRQLDALPGPPQSLLIPPDPSARREMGANAMNTGRCLSTVVAAHAQGIRVAQEAADFLLSDRPSRV